MKQGTVKWFNRMKGYGFIQMEDGTEVFAHYTGINAEGYKKLDEGQTVSFDLVEGDKGLQAVNITVVE